MNNEELQWQAEPALDVKLFAYVHFYLIVKWKEKDIDRKRQNKRYENKFHTFFIF